jgi:cytochrome c oxidase subunit 2
MIGERGLARSRRGLLAAARGACICAALGALSLTSACGGAQQSVLDPAGPQAVRTGKLWWLFFYVCAVIFVAVLVALVLALRRAQLWRDETHSAREVTEPPVLQPAPEKERRTTNVIVGAVAVTVVILFVFLVASFSVGRSLSTRIEQNNKVTIEVTGHQWWWQVRYTDTNPQNIFETANEIHIPVGVPVTLELKSQDVIHSFWVPNLAGKKDLIPGKTAILWLRADHPGTYRGQCAEYCGLQHAHMALNVVAEPREQFDAWLAHQRAPASQPTDDSQQRGQQVFLSSPCIMCHTITGTTAGAHVGPDLTHLASRSTIAAATLPNTRGHLAGWVVDSQGVKPGNQMPPNNISSEDLMALLDYLQSLK